MSKFTWAGLLSWLGGFLLLGFQGISTLMDDDGKWKSMNILDIVEPEYLEWADRIPWSIGQNAVNYLLSMPLFALLFCVGTLAFIINAFLE